MHDYDKRMRVQSYVVPQAEPRSVAYDLLPEEHAKILLCAVSSSAQLTIMKRSVLSEDSVCFLGCSCCLPALLQQVAR